MRRLAAAAAAAGRARRRAAAGTRGPRARRLVAGEGIDAGPRPPSARRDGAGSIRIAVVTHGAASSAFWAIVRNGVDAAGAPDGRARSPTARRTSTRRAHARPDRPGGRPPARRPRRLDPRARPRAGDPPRRARRHPGRLDQLRQRPVAQLGVLAHVGQPEDAGGLRGRPAHGGAAGVRQRAVRQPGARATTALDQRCAGFARGDARGRRRHAHVVLDVDDRDIAAPQARGRARWRAKADGVLTLDSDAARRRSTAKKAAAARRARSSARSTSRPRSSRRSSDGRIDLRGRPAGLPAGLHADRDAHPARALRPLPVDGADVVHRAELRHASENAQLALQHERARDPLAQRRRAAGCERRVLPAGVGRVEVRARAGRSRRCGRARRRRATTSAAPSWDSSCSIVRGPMIARGHRRVVDARTRAPCGSATCPPRRRAAPSASAASSLRWLAGIERS